ncbi:MAG: OsmC family protein [Ilumatobacteraceae bacterium]|jgi:uncharacterized OsmC-like protein
MTTTATNSASVRNGVPVDKLFATIGAVREQPDLGEFRFTARSSWIEGTATRSTFPDWYGVGATREHAEVWVDQSDHPTLGHGHGPTPHEHVLHALASCLTLGIATTAAARKIELTKIESTVEGDIDVRGILGIDPDVRNGFSEIRATFVVEGDADRATLDALVEASCRRSATFDMLVNPTPVKVTTAAAG